MKDFRINHKNYGMTIKDWSAFLYMIGSVALIGWVSGLNYVADFDAIVFGGGTLFVIGYALFSERKN